MSRYFYKFVSDASNDLSVLKSFCAGTIKFSRIPDLNDSSEECITTNFKEYRSSLKKMQKEGLTVDDRQTLKKHLNLLCKINPADKNQLLQRFNCLMENDKPLDFKSFEYATEELKKAHKEILNKVGIFCVTKKITSFPMWDHYADKTKGVAIEFKNLDQCFGGDNGKTGVFNELKPIEYSEGVRPSVTLRPSELDEIFFSKLDQWQYEGEYRVVKLLEDCPPNDKGIHLFRIDKKYISRVIVGWKCKRNMKEIKRACGDIPVVKAKLNKYGNIVIPA